MYITPPDLEKEFGICLPSGSPRPAPKLRLNLYHLPLSDRCHHGVGGQGRGSGKQVHNIGLVNTMKQNNALQQLIRLHVLDVEKRALKALKVERITKIDDKRATRAEQNLLDKQQNDALL